MAAVLRLLVAGFVVAQQGIANLYGGYESCRIAASIASGHGFSSPYGIASGPTAWLPPVYPCIVALVFKVLGVYSVQSLWCLILLNIGFAVLTAVFIFRIGLRCFGPMTAFAASFLWAVDLSTVIYCVRLWESSLSAMLVTLGILLALRMADSIPERSEWILYGLFWGFVALTNTALVAIMPLTLLALVHGSGRQAWKYASLTLLVCGCVLLPWSIRNYVTFQKVIPIRGNFGPNLWYGNHPGVTGPADETLDPTKNASELQAYLTMGEASYCASRQHMAIEFIRQNPGQFLRLTGRRISYFWTASEASSSVWRFGVSLLAFVGLVLMRRNSAAGVVACASALLLFPLTYYVTHSESFYRHPIEPVVALLLAYACVTMLGWVRSSSHAAGKGKQDSGEAGKRRTMPEQRKLAAKW